MKKMAIIFGCLLLAWFVPATAQPQLELSVNLPNDPVEYGDPLIIEMRVENTGDEASGTFSVFSSFFHRIYYFGDSQEGCELFVFVTEIPEPMPMPPLFGFTWPNEPLQPGESRLCRITYPMIVHPDGEETVDLRISAPDTPSYVAASFTYTLLGEPPAPVAQPVPAIRWPALVFLAFALGIIGAVSAYRSRRTI